MTNFSSYHGSSVSTRSLQELAAFHGFGNQFMFSQRHKRSMLAFERGQIVLITHHFLIVRGLNGKLTVWLLTGNTAVKAVAPTTTAQTIAPVAAVPVLTTHHFLIVRGLNGKLTVWLLTGNTAVKAVAPTTTAQTIAPVAAVPVLTTGTATQA